MGGRWVSRFCEICARRFDLRGPEPGELGLDRIETAFRFCSTCGLAVGRACCWNSEAVACVACAPVGQTSRLRHPPTGEKGKVRLARRALAQLANSVLASQRLAIALDARLKLRDRAELSSWEDVWWDAGWLILRIESYRDVATEAVLQASFSETARARISDVPLVGRGGRFPALATELQGQLDVYQDARTAIEKRLVAAGRPLRDAERRPPQPLRGPRLAVATAVFVAVLTVTTGAAGVAILGGALEQPSGVGQNPAERTGGVLGKRAEPSAPAPSAAVPHEPELVALVDFNVLRIGSLAGASDAIDGVTGNAEVVAFPSPFDRSVRLTGPEPDGFCVAGDQLTSGSVLVALDLYSEAPLATGSLELFLSPRTGEVTPARIPLNLLGSLPPKHWYHLEATWGSGTTLAVDVSDGEHGRVLSEKLPPVTTTQGSGGQGLCLAASGMSTGMQLLLDNVQVEQ
jgi:hypothetical protein